jgi:hypothetical protein
MQIFKAKVPTGNAHLATDLAQLVHNRQVTQRQKTNQSKRACLHVAQTKVYATILKPIESPAI